MARSIDLLKTVDLAIKWHAYITFNIHWYPPRMSCLLASMTFDAHDAWEFPGIYKALAQLHVRPYVS